LEKNYKEFFMRNDKRFIAGLFGFLLIIGLVFMGCPTGSEDPEPVNDDPLGALSAAIPDITKHPVSRNYESAANIEQLSVTVSPPTDGGILSYQWYSNTVFKNTDGTLIEGETGATCTPAVSGTGDFIYYVVVTNTNEDAPRNKTTSLASSPARIRVQTGSTTPPSASLTIDNSVKYQYIRGLGGMSSVVFRAGNGGSSPDININEIDTMFNPNGKLRYNMLRIMLYDDLDGVIGNKYPGGNGVWQDNSDYWDIVKRVNQYDGYVYACPWTAPAYYKTNNSLVGGGALKTELYGEYAKYLQDFLKRHNSMGAPLYAVSIQNEPNVSVGYEGMDWSNAAIQNFHKEVGRFTNGIPGYGGGQVIPSVKIVSAESANSPQIYDLTLNDPEARPNVDIIARHYYGNTKLRYTLALDDPNGGGADKKEVWQTEFNDSTNDSSANHNLRSTWNWVWFMMNIIDCSHRLNDESAFVYWYSKRFYGMISDGQYGAPPEGTILPRGYAMAHYSRFTIDTTRIAVTNPTGLPADFNSDQYIQWGTGTSWATYARATAYESKDGNTLSMVMYTPTKEDGSSGSDLGDVQINLPWIASGAYAEYSDEDEKLVEYPVVLSADGRSGVVNVPRGVMISLRFTK
jgi:O-glycosyl hydrolase